MKVKKSLSASVCRFDFISGRLRRPKVKFCLSLSICLVFTLMCHIPVFASTHTTTIMGYNCTHIHLLTESELSATAMADYSYGTGLSTITCRVTAKGKIGEAVVATIDSGTVTSHTSHVEAMGNVTLGSSVIEATEGTAYFMGSPWSTF